MEFTNTTNALPTQSAKIKFLQETLKRIFAENKELEAEVEYGKGKLENEHEEMLYERGDAREAREEVVKLKAELADMYHNADVLAEVRDEYWERVVLLKAMVAKAREKEVEIFTENQDLKAEKLKDTIMLEEHMFERQNISPAEKVEMKGYWTVERVLENEREFLEDYHAEQKFHDAYVKEVEEVRKELEEKVGKLYEEKENMRRIWEGQNEEQEEAKSAMMILLCDKVNKLADKDAEIKKLKKNSGNKIIKSLQNYI